MEDLQSLIEGQDYSVLERQTDDRGLFKSISSKKKDRDLFFVIEREPEMAHLDTYTCYVKMVGVSNFNIGFTVKEQMVPTAIVEVESTNPEHFFIEAQDTERVAEFVYNPRIFLYLDTLLKFSYDKRLQMNSTKERSLIRFRTDCNFTNAVATLPYLESIFDLLQEGYDFDQLVSGTGNLICRNCSSEIAFQELKCQNCGETAPKCVICFRPADKEAYDAIINCCSSYVHVSEFKTWINVNRTCPYCRLPEPTITLVE